MNQTADLFFPTDRGASHIEVLSEENYVQSMREQVEPALAATRHDGYLTVVRGMRIRYEFYLCSDPVGAVVLCHGFTESAEKMREFAWYLLRAGYSVFALDHRGHGRSYREPKDTSLTHIGKFEDYVSDLDLFVQKIVKPNAVNLPLCLYGHSMGGAIAGLYLSKHPVEFRKAILSSPMISAYTRGVPHWITSAVSRFYCLTGRAKARMFLYGKFDPEEKHGGGADHSKARSEYYQQKRIADPYLQNTAPTYSWLAQAMRVTRLLLRRSACAAIQAPVLLFQSGIDTYVLPEPQEKFISRIPHGELVRFPEARHGLYMSENEVFQPYLDRVLGFFAK